MADQFKSILADQFKSIISDAEIDAEREIEAKRRTMKPAAFRKWLIREGKKAQKEAEQAWRDVGVVMYNTWKELVMRREGVVDFLINDKGAICVVFDSPKHTKEFATLEEMSDFLIKNVKLK